MMLLPYLEYDGQIDLDLKISEHINKVLLEIIRFIKESHEAEKEVDGESKTNILEAISPHTMLRDSPKKCEDTLDELYDLLASPAPRKEISPKYEFFLFHCIKYYVDLMRDMDLSLTEEIPEPLYSEILKVYGEEMIKELEDVDNYLDFCFCDWGFLPDFLGNAVGIYLSNSSLLEVVMTVDELDEYIELMDADIKEAYLKKRKNECQKIDLSKSQFSEIRFSKDLVKALIIIQKNKNYIGAQENTINDAIRDHLSMIYEIHDQTRYFRKQK